jgi:hypothetical protein
VTWAFEDGRSPARQTKLLAARFHIDNAAENDDHGLELSRQLQQFAGFEIGHGKSNEVALALGGNDSSSHDSPFNSRRIGRIGGPSRPRAPVPPRDD